MNSKIGKNRVNIMDKLAQLFVAAIIHPALNETILIEQELYGILIEISDGVDRTKFRDKV